MATNAHSPNTNTSNSRSSSTAVPGNTTSDRKNGNNIQSETSAARNPPVAATAKKAKTKKPTDPSETQKMLAAKINQLEHDRAGEKDQEAEIGGLMFIKVLPLFEGHRAGLWRRLRRLDAPPRKHIPSDGYELFS